MIYPSIDKLLNIVDSKYKLVHLVSKRSRQIYETNQFQKPDNQYIAKKNIGRALEEISEDLIHIK